jgi:hypothetical protein
MKIALSIFSALMLVVPSRSQPHTNLCLRPFLGAVVQAPPELRSAGPGKDVSLNFVPVVYPLYRPAEFSLSPLDREF